MRRFLFKNYVREGKTSAFASKPKAKNVWAASLAGLMFSVAILGLVPPSGACSLNAHTGHGALGAPAEITPHADDKIFYTTTAGLAVKKQNNTLYTTLNGQVYTVLGQGDGGSTYYVDGYIQKEYLESTGTQYIDTGLIFTKTHDYEIRGNYTSTSAPQYMGAYETGRRTYLVAIYGSNFGSVWQGEVASMGSPNTNVHIWSSKDSIAYLDGVSSLNFSNLTISSRPSYLFASNDAVESGLYAQCKFKMQYAKFWDNGVLVRDFVPVQCPCKKSVGMYDKVNKILYENAGTGDFIVGPNAVPSEVLSAPVYDNFSYASENLSESLSYRTVEGFEMVGGVERGYLLCQSQTNGDYLKLRI